MESKTAYCLFGQTNKQQQVFANIQTYIPNWDQFDYFGHSIDEIDAGDFPFVDLHHHNFSIETLKTIQNLQEQSLYPHLTLSNSFFEMIASLHAVSQQVTDYQKTQDQHYSRFVFQHWNTRYTAPVDLTVYNPSNVLSNRYLGPWWFSQLWMMFDQTAFAALDKIYDEIFLLSADPGRYWFNPGDLVYLFLESQGLKFEKTTHPMDIANFQIVPTGLSLV